MPSGSLTNCICLQNLLLLPGWQDGRFATSPLFARQVRVHRHCHRIKKKLPHIWSVSVRPADGKKDRLFEGDRTFFSEAKRRIPAGVADVIDLYSVPLNLALKTRLPVTVPRIPGEIACFRLPPREIPHLVHLTASHTLDSAITR